MNNEFHHKFNYYDSYMRGKNSKITHHCVPLKQENAHHSVLQRWHKGE